MDKELLFELENSIKNNRLFDFISNRGYKFEKEELLTLLKEVVYVAENKVISLGTKEDVKSLGKELLSDLKEFTSFYED